MIGPRIDQSRQGSISMSKQFIERRIVIGLITNDQYIREISPVFDSNLLKDDAARKLASWCIRHYKKHGVPPKRDIAVIFDSYVRRKLLSPDEVEDIELILDDLSEEFEEGEEINVEPLLDETFSYFEENRLIRLSDEIKYEAEKGNLEAAQVLLVSSRQVQRVQQQDCDFFADDPERTMKIFDNVQEPLLEYPGALGRLWNRHFVRGGFFGLLGPEKTGKTWWLMDIAFQAMKAGRKVAFFAAGDMNREEMELRKYIYMAKKSNDIEYCGDIIVPTIDCFWNQNGSCPNRESIEAPIRGEKPPKLEEMEKIYTDAWEEYKTDHVPCRRCMGKREFLGAPWFTLREKVEPLSWKEGYNIEKEFKRKFRSGGWNFVDHTSDSLTPRMMDDQLTIWHENGFTADFILVDYPDIMACDDEDRRLDFRHRENMKWKKLRGMAHKWHSCVVAPTQADGASYGKPWIGVDNYSEDKRKYSHATAFFGLNQTDAEAALGIFRINQLMVRSGRRGAAPVTVCQRLEMGRPFLTSW